MYARCSTMHHVNTMQGVSCVRIGHRLLQPLHMHPPLSTSLSALFSISDAKFFLIIRNRAPAAAVARASRCANPSGQDQRAHMHWCVSAHGEEGGGEIGGEKGEGGERGMGWRAWRGHHHVKDLHIWDVKVFTSRERACFGCDWSRN